MSSFSFDQFSIHYHGKTISPEIKAFLERNHYKRSARSLLQEHVYALYHEDLLVGVAVYGKPFSRSAVNVYGKGTVELRRFCLIDEAPRNSESFFLGRTLRALKKLGVPRVLSYADPNKKHIGTIYRASNFRHVGVEKYRQQVLVYKKREISMRVVYQKKHGKYVPSARRYQDLKRRGFAKAMLTQAKHIYLYEMERRHSK